MSDKSDRIEGYMTCYKENNYACHHVVGPRGTHLAKHRFPRREILTTDPYPDTDSSTCTDSCMNFRKKYGNRLGTFSQKVKASAKWEVGTSQNLILHPVA
jgi:hypothetical protein